MAHSPSTAILRALSLIVALTLLVAHFGPILPAAAAPPRDAASASGSPVTPTPTTRSIAPASVSTAGSARTSITSAKAATSTTSAIPCGPAVPSVEVTPYRTRTSRTYLGPNGAYQTVSCTDSVNYQDANGVWQPIDNTLVPSTTSGYALQNAANAFTTLFPSSLATTPLTVTKGSAAVSFSLVGAGPSAPTTSGSTVTYTGVLPNVTTSYRVLNDAVKETLTLQNAAAPSTYSFRVSASGLSAKANAAGGIDFLDANGVAQLSFAPPFFQDSAASPSVSPATFSLTQVGSTLTVAVSASPAWLTSASRVWPIVLDPSVTVNPSQNCTVGNGAYANVNLCPTPGSVVEAGYDGSSLFHGLVQFDLSAVPSRATVLDGALQLDLYSAMGGNSSLVGAYPVQQAWVSTQTTWTTAQGTTRWSTPGGTIGPLVTSTAVSVVGIGVWSTWGIAALVQRWVNGTAVNQGVLLKEVNEAIQNLYVFDGAGSSNPPALSVTWQPWLGEQPYWTDVTVPLTDRSHLHVNVANGNLVLHARDLTIAGTGLPLDLERYYNSLAPGGSAVGVGWTMSLPITPYLDTSLSSGVALYGPSGGAVLFPLQGGGTFGSPPGIEATLVKHPNGTYSLTAHQDATTETFGVAQPNGRSYLTSIVDRNGNTITLSYNPDNTVKSITDTQNRTVSFTYGTFGGRSLLTQITDWTGRSVQYNDNPTTANLTDYYDANNAHTVYHYNSNGLLNQIDDPLGNQTKITYDSGNRVSTIIRVTNLSQGTGPTTSFTYPTSTTTQVTDPDTNVTTYSYDGYGRVTQVQDAQHNSQAFTWTSDNQVQTHTDAYQHTTTYTYATDGTNNLLKVQIPTGASTSWTYTDASHPYDPTTFTDAQTNVTTYAYDTAGNLHTITDPLTTQNQATITHNFNGTVSSVMDFNLNTWSYGYDGVGNLTTITPPTTTMPSPGAPLGPTSIAPDALSRPHIVVDGALKQTTTTYDNLDRPTLITYNDNSTIGYTYDADGNVLAMADTTGTTNSLYDALNRKTQKTLPNATGTCPISTTGIVCYAYDNASNLLSLEDRTGTVSYGYNSLNEVTSLVEPPINGTSPQVTFGYDANHNRTTKTFPGSTVETTTFDNAQRPTEIKTVNGSTVLNDLIYSYQNGTADTLLTQSVVRSDNANDNSTTVNTYDPLNRLTTWNVTAPQGSMLKAHTYTYAYDGNSNRTLIQTTPTNYTNLTYNPANELASAAAPGLSTVTYYWDGAGNMLGNSGRPNDIPPSNPQIITYNAQNQLATITDNAPTSNTIPMAYTGPGESERISAGWVSSNPSTPWGSNTFTYGSGTLTQTNAAGTEQGTIGYSHLPDGTLVSQRVPNAGTNYYYSLDQDGSVLRLVNNQGVAVATYVYCPTGNDLGDLTLGDIALNQPYRYLGQFYDPGSQMYYDGYYIDSNSGVAIQLCPLPIGGISLPCLPPLPLNSQTQTQTGAPCVESAEGSQADLPAQIDAGASEGSFTHGLVRGPENNGEMVCHVNMEVTGGGLYMNFHVYYSAPVFTLGRGGPAIGATPLQVADSLSPELAGYISGAANVSYETALDFFVEESIPRLQALSEGQDYMP